MLIIWTQKVKLFYSATNSAIGKEVIFEYSNDIKNTISTAHNIDIWLLGNEVYNL